MAKLGIYGLFNVAKIKTIQNYAKVHFTRTNSCMFSSFMMYF